MKGKHVTPDEGNLYRRNNDMFVKVTSQDTDGAYEVCEERCPPGFSSKRHKHTQAHETFVILEGSAKFEIGDDTFAAKQGDIFHVPPDIPHKVTAGDKGLRMLLIFSPAFAEPMFNELTNLTPEQKQNPEIGKAISAKYNTILVGND